MSIYFDNSATTKVDSRVYDKMLPFFKEKYGNPSSIHIIGRVIRPEIDAAREKIANLIKSDADEIIFTASGTEANNIAIKRGAKASLHKGKHIITSVIEHKAVLEPCHALEREGYEVTYIDVNSNGIIDLDKLKQSIRKDTVLISVMLANNEIGTIQPIKEIANIAHDHSIYVHTDAVQAIGKIKVDISDLGVDMLTLSGHKIYAPKGIGVLYIDKELQTNIAPLINGGSQEFGLRAGTENVPYIIALSEACDIIDKEMTQEVKHIKTLRDHFEARLLSEISDTYINGDIINRVVSISNITFRFIEGEALMAYAQEICCSAGSACTSSSSSPSHVLNAIGVDPIDYHGALRFSFGRYNNVEEVDKSIEILKSAVLKLRAMSPLLNRN